MKIHEMGGGTGGPGPEKKPELKHLGTEVRWGINHDDYGRGMDFNILSTEPYHMENISITGRYKIDSEGNFTVEVLWWWNKEHRRVRTRGMLWWKKRVVLPAVITYDRYWVPEKAFWFVQDEIYECSRGDNNDGQDD